MSRHKATLSEGTLNNERNTMSIDLSSIPQLQKVSISSRERWIYVADFNISHTDGVLHNTGRIDCELDDVRHILSAGGVIAFLAHKGRYKDGDAGDLDFVVPYLQSKLGAPVSYFAENDTQAAVDYVKALEPGAAAVMGNTRFHAGEEANDPSLASQFAKLGVKCAIGGFGKAHRAHASNVGIQQHIPCFLADSQMREMKQLELWAGRDESRYSVAVLGGVKKEKITTGLVAFSQTYDAVIPGGIVLNTVLKARGFETGGSLLQDGGKSFEDVAGKVLDATPQDRILIPQKVVIAQYRDRAFHNTDTICISDGVPGDYMIVDYILPASAIDALDRMAETQGRLILAGTPGIYTAGFRHATDAVIQHMQRNAENCIVLGGDTAAEVKHAGPVSTGGGSALHFVAYGTTPVLEAFVRPAD